MFTGPIFPAPNDWFNMEMPGIYTLELEIQLLRPPMRSNEVRQQVVRFPPTRIRVEKPIAVAWKAFSTSDHGMSISIVGLKSNGLARFDDNIILHPSFTNIQNVLFQGLDLSAAFKWSMWEPDGKDALKTAFGQKIGVNFDLIQTMEKLPVGTTLAGPDIMSATPGIVPEQPLPVLKECFVMDKPGIYMLVVHMQMFVIGGRTAGEPGHEELLRFPPIAIKVVRP
jgi:hypothetical protein